jgi:two-component system, cell cycle response regulator
VPDSKILDLLVIEDDPEDEQLLCEALIEIEEKRMWGNWRAASVVYADHLADALDCLRRGRFDAVLLNLSLPDGSPAMETFLEAHACAGGAPVIILADEEDENLAHRLIHEGAEDFLLKRELECAPLARSIRYSIERRRRNQANQISPLADSGTGALSCQAFTTVAYHYTNLAVSQNLPLHLATIEIRGIFTGTVEDRQASEILLMRVADLLQTSMPLPALIGRVGKCRFASILAGVTIEEAESAAAHTAARLEELIVDVPGAGIQLSVTHFRDADRLEALLAEQAAHESRPLAKPVMLAD